MTGHEDADYRLLLARRSLAVAADQLAAGARREAALFARGAIEHAAKSIAACFGPVPRSHEPGLILARCVADARFPQPLCATAAVLGPLLDGYGMQEHMLLSYGDEQARIDPWTLVTEARAGEAVRIAGEAVSLAERCLDELYGKR